MTKITQIDDRSAATAWSPIRAFADVIALGAKDSGGIGFDETGGELELYDLKMSSSRTAQPVLLGSVKTQSRFSSLGWTLSKYPMGMLAGGMENGAVHVWNPQAIVSQKPSIVASFDQHAKGPVKALQFNGLNPTQLATGGSDGKVLIANLDQPDVAIYTPCANNSQQRAQITAIGWNTQVAHIVASAAADGTVAVWDLKSRKAWCELRAETTGQAVADIGWNPSQGLHLLTASADDRNPVIKLWDLRTSTSMPLATLVGHNQGILSMSWCPHDEHLLLSCGKDNRTILWDLYTLQPVADVPNDQPETHSDALGGGGQDMFAGAGGLASNQQRRYDVQWSPIKRGVASTCSLDRKVQIHSILGLSSKAGRPPKWMRPSSGVSCGFGGSVVSFGSKDKLVRIATVMEQPELAKTSRVLEQTLNSMSLIDFCFYRASNAKDPHERQLWAFMKVIFETNARQQLLDTLGFDPSQIAQTAASYTEEVFTNGVESMSLKEASFIGMSKSTEEVVKKALLVGNFEAAVECCFRTGNLADALVLASCGGADLWTKTQDRYFQSQSPKRQFLSTVSAIIRNELEDLVQKSDPKKWTETLAILSTYGKSDEFPNLCITLGDRLEESGDLRSASLCYMCSLSLERAVKFWRSQLEAANAKKGSTDLLALHDFVVVVSVFLQAVGTSATLPDEDSTLFSEYASKLAEQGLLVTAAKYAKGDSLNCQILRDRLYRSKASPECLAAMGGVVPEFPFSYSDSKKSRVQTSSFTNQQQAQQDYSRQDSHQSSVSSVSYSQQGHGLQSTYQQSSGDVLPPGWVALQDPASGCYYYANQTTGEVTWDRPQVAPSAEMATQYSPKPSPSPAVQRPAEQQQSSSSVASNSTPLRTTQLVAKYGDGFVTSASHPELASQYGNVGTSNPYHGTARPGTAQVASGPPKAPVSNDLDPDKIGELQAEYQPVSDCLLSLVEALKKVQLSTVDKRLLGESEKAVAVLLKRLARGQASDDIGVQVLSMCGYINSYDFRSAQSVHTGLVNSDWKDHKDWLKGTKALLQLATKKFSQ